MIGKLICWITKKHKRGKFVGVESGKNIFRCPRCGRRLSYKVKS